MADQADIGVYGLAVMGRNLARNLARNGYRVAIHNRSIEKMNSLLRDHPEANFIPADSVEDLVSKLRAPRIVLVMVKAGPATDAVVDQLAAVMSTGDIIIDGGNSYFKDTIRREKAMSARGLEFVGMGVSGGELGALEGPSLMPGGSVQAYRRLGPILEKIAAQVDGEPCVTHLGPNGAGHFVKMVHNGIEYADMALITETYHLMRELTDKSPYELAKVFAAWNKTELESYLIEITARVLEHKDPVTGKPFVDVVLDQAGAKGTGAWTGEAALELGMPATAITEAVYARSLSDCSRARREARASFRTSFSRPKDTSWIADTARNALYAGKILAYSQGFDVISAGSRKYDWNIDLGACARIWRGGCIIRALFLDRITAAYKNNPELPALMLSPDFTQDIIKRESALRKLTVEAVNTGLPAPVFASCLAYLDGLRSKRLPAALVQGLRDYFGAHTYRRVDKPGVFHTMWAGDLSEVEADKVDIH